MHGREIAVCISERGVDLNGACVTLQGAVHIAHLLQRVAHVGIGVGECGRDANRFFVMENRVRQFALLLEDRREVRVRGCELRVDLEAGGTR